MTNFVNGITLQSDDATSRTGQKGKSPEIVFDPKELGNHVLHSVAICPYCPQERRMEISVKKRRNIVRFGGPSNFCEHTIYVGTVFQNALLRGDYKPDIEMVFHDLWPESLGGSYLYQLAFGSIERHLVPASHHRAVETELWSGQSPGHSRVTFICMRSWAILAESAEDFIHEAVALARKVDQTKSTNAYQQ